MSPLAELPDWAAVVVALLVLLGAVTTLTGMIGLLRLPTFYERVHAPTLGTTLGMASIVLASIVCFSVLGSRPVVHEILILVFVTATTPATLVMLTRAAVYRDRAEGNDPVPRSRPDR
ncbi:MAG TPA: monovalent cation/H(+) antiporter subunit G [Pseudomonadales bacterium]